MAASDLPLGQAPRASALDKFLSLFSRVHPGEGVSVVLLISNLFLLLGAYYTLKIIRDSLIVSDKGGAEAGSYASAAMAVVLVFLLPAYGRFGTKVDRIRLITWVTLFFVTHLPIFYWLGSSGVKIGLSFTSGWASSTTWWWRNAGHSPTISIPKSRASGFSR